MLLCSHCQTQNADGAVFCTGCGQPLRSAPATYGRPMAEEKKGLAVASLVLGVASLPFLACFGIGLLFALVGGVLGVVALLKASREPHAYGGKGMAVAGLVCSGLSLLLVPVVAAIAIPSLLRARVSANEVAAIGDVRAVISAQTAYASANGGYYDTLECLATPSNCIPDYAASAPTFLDVELSQAQVKNGYRRTLYLGRPVDPRQASGPISPSSVRSYAYVAVPVNRGQTGVRSFCGDSSGRVCQAKEGRQPSVTDGQCGEPCEVVY